MNAVSCPACDGTGNDLVGTVNDYRVLSCRSCRLVFADPMHAGSSGFYKSHLVYRSSDEATVAQHCRSADNAANRRLLAMLPAGAKTLDVGCGFGSFVHLAVRNGFDAYGLDFNDEQIRAGREILRLGNRLTVGDIADFRGASDGEMFSLVTLFEVIEHVESPRDLVGKTHRLLRKGGLLAVSCPNEARWQPGGRVFVDYPPHHLTRWRPETLRSFLERYGFQHVDTAIESSFCDPVWVAYVNRSARKKDDLAESAGGGVRPAGKATRSDFVRRFKMFLYHSAKFAFAPADFFLKIGKVGTMGMRMILRKR